MFLRGVETSMHTIRLVIFLSVVISIFEKLVNNRLVDLLEKCSIFSDFQYGFRSS